MDYLLICLLAFVGSALTLFSGFGLGTILVPVFALYFPIQQAIALTAVVHFLNNLFKLSLLGKHADKNIILKFGIPSVIAAFAGAYVLGLITDADSLYSYHLFEHHFHILPLKLIIGSLLIFFSLFDIIPYFSSLQFDTKYLFAGGLLSGFFGGLSGNQGALRSAFLIRANLSKEAFIASGVVIACFIDVSRLSVYYSKVIQLGNSTHFSLLVTATLAAFIGTFFGNKLVKKITIKTLQITVAIAILIFGALLALGIL